MHRAGRRAIAGPLVGLGLVVLAPGCPTSAASQGSLGATSHGSITIRVSVRAPVGALGLSDFTVDGASSAAQELCLHGAPRTSYTLAVRGSGPAGALSLSNGQRNIPYRVEWRSHAAPGAVGELSGETALPIPAGAGREDCRSASGAGRVSLAFAAADAESLRAGAPYSGVLLLLLAPD